VVCLLLPLLLSYTDNVPGSLSLSLSLSLSSVCGGGHLAWMGKSGGGLPPNNVVFFHFIFKNKKGNQRGEILWLFFLLGKWFTGREDDRECTQCLFSFLFLYFPSDKFGVVFLSNSPPFYFIPARNFASRVDLLHAGLNNGIFSFPKLIIT
jgi:hypothetical protein